jgi:GNAT superfamily N-acetyltransferase
MSAVVIDVVADKPDPAARDRILNLLDADNLAKSGWSEGSDFAVLIRDPATDEVLGGLWGTDDFGWAFITYLFVPSSLRGQNIGARLIREAETIARNRGMVGLWVNTFDFQAAGFYEKQGFVQFGALERLAGAAGQVFLKKPFACG